MVSYQGIASYHGNALSRSNRLVSGYRFSDTERIFRIGCAFRAESGYWYRALGTELPRLFHHKRCVTAVTDRVIRAVRQYSSDWGSLSVPVNYVPIGPRG